MDLSRGSNLIDGRHHDGNPATGQRGSRLEADFINMVGEELVETVRWAGMTPNYDDRTQLREALKRAAVGVNVRNFGAKGDGIQDDAFAFQAAQDHIDVLGGGTIVVPTGNYRIGTGTNSGAGGDKTSIVVGSNTHWLGQRGANLIVGARDSDHGNNCFLLRNVSNVVIEGLAADGQAVVPADQAYSFVAMEGLVERARVLDCDLRNFANFAVKYGDASTDPTVARFEDVLLQDVQIGGVCGLEGDGSGINIYCRSSINGRAASRNLRIIDCSIDVSNGSKNGLKQGPQCAKVNNTDGVVVRGLDGNGGKTGTINITNGCRQVSIEGCRGRNSTLGLNISSSANAPVANPTKFISVKGWQYHQDGFEGNAVGLRIKGAVRGLSVDGVRLVGANMEIADNYAEDLALGDTQAEAWRFGAVEIVNGNLVFSALSNPAQPALEGVEFGSVKLTGDDGQGSGRVVADGWPLHGCLFKSITGDRTDGIAVTLGGRSNIIEHLAVVNGNPSEDANTWAYADEGVNNTVKHIHLGGDSQNITHFFNASQSLGGLAVESTSGTPTHADRIRVIDQEATPTFRGGARFIGPVLDLSEAAITEFAFPADRDYTVASIELLYTEATSADAGVTVRVGSAANSAGYFGSFTTTPSAAAGAIEMAQNTEGTNTLANRYLARGDTMTFTCVGGKTGAGKVRFAVNMIKGD